MNDLSQQSIANPPTRISARELHKYVLGLIGIFMLFVTTYPIAIHRVKQQTTLVRERTVPNSLSVVSTSIEPQPRK
jgi:hypothetical protein